MPVLRVGVEHIEKGLFSEVGHFLFYGLSISDGVTLRQAELGQWCPRRCMVEEGEILLGKGPVIGQRGYSDVVFKMYSHFAVQIQSKLRRVHAVGQGAVCGILGHQSQKALDAVLVGFGHASERILRRR